MFKNLLDPNSEKALVKALETLDQTIADQRQALVQLIISNQEKLSESPLIPQIKELSTLFEIHKYAQPLFKQKIEHLLSVSLSAKNLSTHPLENNKALDFLNKAISAHQHDIIYTIAALSDCMTLNELALTKISESKQEQLLKDAKSEATKTLIIKNITTIETLKRLEKEYKGKDKHNFRQLQEQIAVLESVINQKKLLTEKSIKITDTIKKLSQSSYVPLYDSKFQHLQTEWKDLLNETNNSNFSISEIIDQSTIQLFEDASNQCTAIIADIAAIQLKEEEKQKNQIFLEKALKNLSAFLSAESVDVEASRELIASIKEKLSKVGPSNSTIDSKHFYDLEKVFIFHQQVMLESKEFEVINQELIELSELFATNHKKKKAEQSTLSNIKVLIDKLDSLKQQLPRINENLDFEIQGLKLFKATIITADSLKKQCLDMQNEYQTKFEKKLAYVKTELENKELHTAKRLCKEAKELLALCPLKQQEKLQKRLDAYQEEVVKLGDWYIFATLPKRKELCEQMNELAKKASRTKIKTLKENIKKLQQSWKELGHARDPESEILWKQFQETADLAYQPIKDLVDRKEQEKQKNLTLRQEIIQKLIKHIEHYYSSPKPEHKPDQNIASHLPAETNRKQQADSYSSEKLLRQSELNWIKAFPIPSGHQILQTQYEAQLQLLNEKLKPARALNLGKKNALIAQAEKMIEFENINDAIEQIKKLQQQWKEIAVSENEEELWTKFKAICDKIFEARESLRGQQKEQEHKSITESISICNAISSLASDSDKTINITQYESEFKKLCSQFEDIKNIPIQRKDLHNNFLKAKKLAKSYLEQLKRNYKSEAFQNIINLCKNLGELEKTIINKTINSDELINRSELMFAQYACPDEAKKALNNSLQKLYEASKINLNTYIEQEANRFKQLCVGLEIELDIDSPASDRALRMELQVKRLNKKFNQNENELTIADKILSAFYLGGINSFQDLSYVNRLMAMQEKIN